MKAILSSLFLSLIIVVSVQAKTIQGIVTDKNNGTPIAGVMIKKGKTHLGNSDKNGKYSINAETGDILEFLYIGYISKKVTVGNETTINIALEQDNKALNEVVVIGYSTQKRSDLTGAVQSVNGEALVKQGNLIKGRVGGVRIRGTVIQPNTESYKEFQDNKFSNPLKEPLSTFAIDVDAASYSNVRRFINMGKLPPADAVRIEEMINYFRYDQASPKGNEPVSIMTELAKAPWNTENNLLRVSLKAKDVDADKLPASNFVFLVDVSGSMSSANKLPLVKASLKLLVDQLRDKDKVAIVTYAGQANVVLESTAGDQKMKIKDIIDGLRAGGSTAGGDGLKMAYDIARRNFIKAGNNRIVMTTDGDFNVGASSDADMETLITRERESGVNISILGYGMGNYKDSKLELLANKGRGNYAYIDNISEARKSILTEFGGTLFTVAKDVKVQVEFNPNFVQAYRLIGYENRLLAAEDFNNDKKVGGDMGVGHVVTAIYEIVPVGVKSSIIGSVDELKYQKTDKKTVSGNQSELATVKFRYKEPHGEKSKLQQQIVSAKAGNISSMSTDFQFISAVAEFGMLLRNSEYKQNANFESLIKRAKATKGKDDEGYRAEFIRMAEDVRALMKSNEVVMN